jgi:hypothetical protein
MSHTSALAKADEELECDRRGRATNRRSVLVKRRAEVSVECADKSLCRGKHPELTDDRGAL